jgi:hypothetical protein
MLPLPSHSPFDGGPIVVTRFLCPDSNLTVEGEFKVTVPFAQLNAEQVRFAELFIRSEGRLNRMETELGLSYPTVRSRLHEIIRAMGYEPGKDEAFPIAPVDRQAVLADLEAGRINFDEAMALLKGSD